MSSGISPWARDQANHLALDRDLADWEHLEAGGLLTSDEERWLENARSTEDAIHTIESGIARDRRYNCAVVGPADLIP